MLVIENRAWRNPFPVPAAILMPHRPDISSLSMTNVCEVSIRAEHLQRLPDPDSALDQGVLLAADGARMSLKQFKILLSVTSFDNAFHFILCLKK